MVQAKALTGLARLRLPVSGTGWPWLAIERDAASRISTTRKPDMPSEIGGEPYARNR